MEAVKKALTRLVRAGLELKKLQDAYVQVGLNDTKLFVINGDILDAIYLLVGEKTNTFEESITHTVMTAPILTVERRVEMLAAEYRKNHLNAEQQKPEMPKPVFFSQEETEKMYRTAGGYRYETPEGDWSK